MCEIMRPDCESEGDRRAEGETRFCLEISVTDGELPLQDLERVLERVMHALEEGDDPELLFPLQAWGLAVTEGVTRKGLPDGQERPVVRLEGCIDGSLRDLWLEEGEVTTRGLTVGDSYVGGCGEVTLTTFTTMGWLFPCGIRVECGECSPERRVWRHWTEEGGAGPNRYLEMLPDLAAGFPSEETLRRDLLGLAFGTPVMYLWRNRTLQALQALGVPETSVGQWAGDADRWLEAHMPKGKWERAVEAERADRWLLEHIPLDQWVRVVEAERAAAMAAERTAAWGPMAPTEVEQEQVEFRGEVGKMPVGPVEQMGAVRYYQSCGMSWPGGFTNIIIEALRGNAQ